MPSLFFEDILVGQSFETEAVSVSKADILSFANSFDPNPFHLDREVARTQGFDDIIAPGMQTLSLSMKLFFDLNLWNDAVLPSPGINSVRWLRPVLPDMKLYVKAEVIEVLPSKSKPNQGIIKILQDTMDRETGAVLMTVEVLHRLKRRPATNAPKREDAGPNREDAV